MRINTNVGAINAHRQLGMTQNEVSQSMAKLSSGFRINRAADDAAGLGTANLLRANTRALTQASRNADQANSLLQIAEGSVGGIQKMLERMKELATQAGSDTVDQASRDRIQAEFNAMRSEISRTVETTVFQGNTLLDGSFGSVGNTLETAEIDVDGAAAAGTYALSVDEDSGALTVSGPAGFTTQTVNLSAATYSGGELHFAVTGLGTVSVDAASATDVESVVAGLDGRGFEVTEAGSAAVAGTHTGDFADSTKLPVSGISSTMETGEYKIVSDGTNLTLQHADGSAVTGANTVAISSITVDAGNKTDTSALNFGVLTVTVQDDAYSGTSVPTTQAAAVTAITAGRINIENSELVSSSITGNDSTLRANFLVGSSGAYKSDDLVSLDAIDLSVSELGIDASSLSTASDARNSLTAIDSAMSTVNQALGKIGAFQNRVENAMTNLKTSIQNFSAAESVIRDLDMAEEMTKFSKNQILSQAGTAMLAQANQSAQGILQLLRG